MYFIVRGDCSISIKSFDEKIHDTTNLLVEGHHFGEISMLFKCQRTATVIARNYNTIAGLKRDHWRELTNENPKFQKLLVHYLATYNDTNKQFLFSLVKPLFFFKGKWASS